MGYFKGLNKYDDAHWLVRRPNLNFKSPHPVPFWFGSFSRSRRVAQISSVSRKVKFAFLFTKSTKITITSPQTTIASRKVS
jgi:hypothetical protein